MATIDNGDQLELPEADPDERIDIFSYVVTKAGWETLESRIKIFSSNRVQILTQLISPPASELINQSKAEWRYLPSNHAKAILYRNKKVAVLGSFNLTNPSLGSNIECFHLVDDPNHYNQLAETFDRYWVTAKQDKAAFATQEKVWAATIGQETPRRQAELTDGPRKPWPFQEEIIQQVMAWLDDVRVADLGRIVKLPTGAGKTLVAAEVIRRLLEKQPQARILWVCHRVELLRQSWNSIYRQINGSLPEEAWFVPQHIKDESSVRDRKEFLGSKDRQLVFCTQGMLPHLLKSNRQEHFDLTIVDECHRFHPKSTTYKLLYRYCERKHIPRLGLTATPLDHDKRQFGRYWDIQSMFGTDLTQEFLVAERFLSRINKRLTVCRPTNYIFTLGRQHAGPEHIESELVTRIGEFNNDNVNREVARAWKHYRDKRQRILCFAVTIDHVDTLKNDFFAKDDSVRVAHSKLTTEENRVNLDWFKAPDTSESRMLVSVLMLAEGIDLPKTDCLFMVRPTFSPELYQQMIGRGLRGPKAEGTEDYAVIDFTSQYVDRNRLRLPFEQITTTIESDEMAKVDRPVPEENEEPGDLDASGIIETVKGLRNAVDDLRNKKRMTIPDACEELAQELDYTAHTLVNYYHSKADDYPLGWEDPEAEPAEQSDDSGTAADSGSEVNNPQAITHNTLAEEPTGSEGYVTMSKLLDLRADDPLRFEEIASLTSVASSTLRSYCSNQENFKRWKTNNKDKMNQVRVILAESRARHSDAA